jgi:hypothetical protein
MQYRKGVLMGHLFTGGVQGSLGSRQFAACHLRLKKYLLHPKWNKEERGHVKGVTPGGVTPI